MKKVIASVSTELLDVKEPLSSFTDEQIAALPAQFTVKTRIPGGNFGSKFVVLDKARFLANPRECVFIDSYWGYAWPSDIYLATREAIYNYQSSRLAELDQEKEKLKNQVRKLSSSAVM